MSAPTPQPAGQIFDRGYRGYEGPRVSRTRALMGLIWDEAKRSLGVKRSWKYKVIVSLVLGIQLVIFLVTLFTGSLSELAAQSGSGPLPQGLGNLYSGFFETSAILILFLTAIISPSLLCDDRRFQVYPLYLSRPIHAYDYLLAKGITAFGVIATVAVGPAVLLFIGKIFLASNPSAYLSGHLNDLWKLLVAGLFISLFYASYGLAFSSLTASRGYAAGAIIGVEFVLSFIGTIIFAFTQSSWAMLASLQDSVMWVKDWIFFGWLQPIQIGDISTSSQPSMLTLVPLSPWIYLGVSVSIIVLGWWLIVARYRREAR